MRRQYLFVLTSVVGLAACGSQQRQTKPSRIDAASSTDDSASRPDQAVALHAAAATAFATALVDSGVPNHAVAPALFAVQADSLKCEISGATAGNLHCTIVADDRSYDVSAADARTFFTALNDHGGQQGSAHAGRVYAAARSLSCQHSVDMPAADTCTFSLVFD